MRYRKKPVVVEAVLYDGEFPMDFLGAEEGVRSAGDGTGACEVWNVPEGCWVRCPVGHWLIRGIQGEIYPCAPDFEATYLEEES